MPFRHVTSWPSATNANSSERRRSESGATTRIRDMQAISKVSRCAAVGSMTAPVGEPLRWIKPLTGALAELAEIDAHHHPDELCKVLGLHLAHQAGPVD